MSVYCIRQNCIYGFLYGIALVLIGYHAFWDSFSLYKDWDDEGFLLSTVIAYTDGKELYSEIFSQYGPVYYFIMDFVYTIIPIDIDGFSARWITNGAVILSSLLLSSIFWISFKKPILGLITLLSSYMLLNEIISDPLHPIMLTTLLLSPLPLLAHFALNTQKPKLPALFFIAALTCLLIFVKINIGIFTLIALCISAAFLISFPNTRIQNAVRLLTFIGILILPFLLMGRQLIGDWVRIYCFAFLVSAIFLLLTQTKRNQNRFQVKDIFIILGSLAVAFVLVIVVAAIQGISAYTLLDVVLLQPLKHPAMFAFGAQFGAFAWHYQILACLINAGCFFVLWGKNTLSDSYACAIFILRTLLCLFLILVIFKLVPVDFLILALPFVWLFALDLDTQEHRLQPLLFVCANLQLLQSLHGFPMYGAQAYAGSLYLPLLIVFALSNGWKTAAPYLATRLRFASSEQLQSGFTGFILFYACFGLAFNTWAKQQRYQENLPLNQQGMESVRVPHDQAGVNQGMVTNAKQFPALLTMPGRANMHQWTGIAPLIEQQATYWNYLLSEQIQETLAKQLENSEDLLLIINRRAFENTSIIPEMFQSDAIYYFIAQKTFPVATLQYYELRSTNPAFNNWLNVFQIGNANEMEYPDFVPKNRLALKFKLDGKTAIPFQKLFLRDTELGQEAFVQFNQKQYQDKNFTWMAKSVNDNHERIDPPTQLTPGITYTVFFPALYVTHYSTLSLISPDGATQATLPLITFPTRK